MSIKERDETVAGVIALLGLVCLIIGVWQFFTSAVALIIIGAWLTLIGGLLYNNAGKP